MAGRRASKRPNKDAVEFEDELDAIFFALSDRTRRSMLDALSRGPLRVGELSAPFEISKPAISKHLKLLESVGLVRRNVDGRVHRCSLEREPLQAAQEWIEERKVMWEGVLDALADYLETEEVEEDD